MTKAKNKKDVIKNKEEFRKAFKKNLEDTTRLDLTNAESKELTETFLKTLGDCIAEGGVKFQNYFTIKKVERKARKGRNPQTGEVINIKSRKSLKLTVMPEFKERLR